MTQIGGKGFSTMYSVYSAMAVGSVFGLGGALVGSLFGYMLASGVYQVSIDMFKHADLTEEAANRLIGIHKESIKHMRYEREEFEKLVAQKLKNDELIFNRLLNNIEEGIKNSDLMRCINSMSEMAVLFGGRPKLASFDEFDAFMKSNETLTIRVWLAPGF